MRGVNAFRHSAAKMGIPGSVSDQEGLALEGIHDLLCLRPQDRSVSQSKLPFIVYVHCSNSLLIPCG